MAHIGIGSSRRGLLTAVACSPAYPVQPSRMPDHRSTTVGSRCVSCVGRGVSVKDYGAVGDGLADDSPAIEAALNDSRTVYFPEGEYRIRKSIVVSRSNTMLWGAGAGLSQIHWPGQRGHILHVEPRDRDLSGIEVRDLGFVGDPEAHGDLFGILANWRKDQAFVVRRLSINGCEVRKTPSAGIVVREGEDVAIRNCYVSDTGRDGIQVTGTDNALIEQNHIERSGDDAIAFHSGYTGRSTSGLISGNSIEDSRAAKGISIGGGRDVIIVGNVVRRFFSRGIDIYYDNNFPDASESPARIIVAQNIILSSSSTSIDVEGGTAAVMIAGFFDPSEGDLTRAVYEQRHLGRRKKYPPAHINIVANFLGTGEADLSSTTEAATQNPLAYGIRIFSCAEEVSILNNQLYNCRESIRIDPPRPERGGQPVYDTIIHGNRFRRFSLGVAVLGTMPLPGGLSLVGNTFRDHAGAGIGVQLPKGTSVEAAANLWGGIGTPIAFRS